MQQPRKRLPSSSGLTNAGSAAWRPPGAGSGGQQAGTSMQQPSTEGPYVPCLQGTWRQLKIPGSLVHQHMPELAALNERTSAPIKVQLVLLPRFAVDITPETPAQQVINLSQGVGVRRNKNRTSSTYPLSGLSLAQSLPAQRGYHVRGIRCLGMWHVQVLCTPELPPELLQAKQSQEQQRQTKRKEQRLQLLGGNSQPQPHSNNSNSGARATAAALVARAAARRPGRVVAAAEGSGAAAAAAAVAAVAAATQMPRPAAAAAAAAPTAPTAAAAGAEPYSGPVIIQMASQVYIPYPLVCAHMPALASAPPATTHRIAVQLVLLPEGEADVPPPAASSDPESRSRNQQAGAPAPGCQVIELREGVTVRKGAGARPGKTDSCVLSGLSLKQSKPVREKWFVRGIRVLGDWHVQLLCSPKLPPELQAAKMALEAQRHQTLQKKKQQQQKHNLQQQQIQQQCEPRLPGAAAAAAGRIGHLERNWQEQQQGRSVLGKRPSGGLGGWELDEQVMEGPPSLRQRSSSGNWHAGRADEPAATAANRAACAARNGSCKAGRQRSSSSSHRSDDMLQRGRGFEEREYRSTGDDRCCERTRKWREQQQQQQQLQQEHGGRLVRFSHSSLQRGLMQVDRAWNQRRLGNSTPCKFWSGIHGSCSKGRSCWYAASHIPNRPTTYYQECADVFEEHGLTRNEVGRYVIPYVIAQPPPPADSGRGRRRGGAGGGGGRGGGGAGGEAADLLGMRPPANGWPPPPKQQQQQQWLDHQQDHQQQSNEQAAIAMQCSLQQQQEDDMQLSEDWQEQQEQQEQPALQLAPQGSCRQLQDAGVLQVPQQYPVPMDLCCTPSSPVLALPSAQLPSYEQQWQQQQQQQWRWQQMAAPPPLPQEPPLPPPQPVDWQQLSAAADPLYVTGLPAPGAAGGGDGSDGHLLVASFSNPAASVDPAALQELQPAVKPEQPVSWLDALIPPQLHLANTPSAAVKHEQGVTMAPVEFAAAAATAAAAGPVQGGQLHTPFAAAATAADGGGGGDLSPVYPPFAAPVASASLLPSPFMAAAAEASWKLPAGFMSSSLTTPGAVDGVLASMPRQLSSSANDHVSAAAVGCGISATSSALNAAAAVADGAAAAIHQLHMHVPQAGCAQQQQQQQQQQVVKCLPAAAGSAELTDAVLDSLIDLLNQLDREFPNEGLDVVGCVEALTDIQDDPAAAQRFMSRCYRLLASAVRIGNLQQALNAVKQYLVPA